MQRADRHGAIEACRAPLAQSRATASHLPLSLFFEFKLVPSLFVCQPIALARFHALKHGLVKHC
jgi:hypothetical protein